MSRQYRLVCILSFILIFSILSTNATFIPYPKSSTMNFNQGAETIFNKSYNLHTSIEKSQRNKEYPFHSLEHLTLRRELLTPGIPNPGNITSDVEILTGGPVLAFELGVWELDDGIWNHSLTIPTKENPYGAIKAIEITDIDGDSQYETIVGSSNNSIQIFEYQSGMMIPAHNITHPGSDFNQITSLAVGDLNNDGNANLEILVSSSNFDVQSAIFRKVSGTYQSVFEISSSHPSGRVGGAACAAGDVDNDGEIEFVVTEEYPSETGICQVRLFKWKWHPPQGKYTWVNIANYDFKLSLMNWIYQVQIIDVNNDGYNDIFINPQNEPVQVLEFAQGQLIRTWKANHFHMARMAMAGDITNDGRTDIVVADHNNDLLYVYETVGKDIVNTFNISVPNLEYGADNNMDIGDIDGDGQNELVFVAPSDPYLHIIRNDTQLDILDLGYSGPDVGSYAVAIGDYDSEGIQWKELPISQDVEYGVNVYYDLNATAPTGIDQWWQNDSVHFHIDGNGIITNITSLLVGHYGLQVWVNNTLDRTLMANFTIKIHPIAPPGWVEEPMDQIVNPDDSLHYDLNATDISGIDKWWLNDTVNFTIDQDGVISNLVSFGPVGSVYDLQVWVNDTLGNTQTAIFSIIIQDTKAPTWDQTPTDQIEEFGISFAYDLNASDFTSVNYYWINDTTHFAVEPNGVVTNVTLLMVGYYWLEVRAYDSYNNFCNASILITVEDTTAPTWIIQPTDQVLEFGQPVSYQLYATDLSDINNWILNDSTHFEISSTGCITNSTVLAAGRYNLMVTAFDSWDNYITANFTITVQEAPPTPPSPPIPGFPIDAIIVGLAIVLVPVLIFRKIKRHSV